MQRFWIWLAQCPGLTPRQKKQLLDHFGDIQFLYRSDKGSLAGANLKEAAVKGLLDKDLTPSQAIIDHCQQKLIGILTYGDSRYPARLRELPDPPLVLYYTGRLPDLNQLAAIAVVGTRKCSEWGLSITRRITGELCRGGSAIVSGMAYGVDAAATAEALQCGATVLGVLGCGVDVIYPAANRALFYRMREAGCLLSEYAPGTKPEKRFFPERNRIISGLCLGTLVTEAPEKSGAMITARAALEQNRDVFAVPGAEDAPAWAGCNRLLEQGATPARCGWDILKTYAYQLPGRFREPEVESTHPWDISTVPPAQIPAASGKKTIDKELTPSYSVVENRSTLSPQAQAVLDVLAQGEGEIDNVIARAGLDPSRSLAVLTMLEMRGLICRPSPQRIALKK